jgi:hypothetical protein
LAYLTKLDLVKFTTLSNCGKPQSCGKLCGKCGKPLKSRLSERGKYTYPVENSCGVLSIPF